MVEEEKKKVEKKETAKVETPKAEKKSESAVQKAKQAVEEIKEKKNKKVEKKDEVVLEREYVVPLRKGFLKVPRYKRAKKAIKTLKEFLVRHMKVEDRDLNKVKIDRYLNEEIWARGIKKPLSKVKVKVVKRSSGIVNVELAEVPDAVKYKKAKDEKFHKTAENVKTPKHSEEKTEQTEAEKEKEEAVKESSEKVAKAQAKEMKHTTTAKHKQTKTPVRKVMKK
jgi:large subunit ribosomal protein L31e